MLEFTRVGRSTPVKRTAEIRRSDFDEIDSGFAFRGAAVQSSRCAQCGIPFCQSGCPLDNNIPDWLMAAASGRLREAYHMSSATNNMPEICGRICPQDRLCEGSCVIEQSGHGTVTIGAVEKYITDTAWEKGWVEPVPVGRESGYCVGIIGAGPAGLAAAEMLRRCGHAVTIYDRYDRAGGLLTYGIPNFKLDKSVVSRRVDRLESAGIVFCCGVDVGGDFAEIRGGHDAVLIATGVYRAHRLGLPGSGAGGVVAALDYLTASNRKGVGLPADGFESGVLDARGKKVVVIGGGDTAMDCVRTAVRQGADSVCCLYRRDRANMPGSAREVSHAEEEGVEFSWLSFPRAILDDDHGWVRGVRVGRMRLKGQDGSARRSVEDSGQSLGVRDCDMVIEALGFEPEDMPVMFDEPSLRVNRHGVIGVDHATMETSVEGVFAAGDVVRGASLVVWAICDGRAAAAGMDAYVRRPKG